MLHPLIYKLVAAAKAEGEGLFTSMVTNGSRLDAPSLLALRSSLDQIAFSVDASSDDIHVALGRLASLGLRVLNKLVAPLSGF